MRFQNWPSWCFLLVLSTLKMTKGADDDYNIVHRDGSFQFGYETPDSYHHADANRNNVVRGEFGGRNPATGLIDSTQYTAGPRGYRPRGKNVHRKYDLNQSGPRPVGSRDDPYYDPYEDPSYNFAFRTRTYNRQENANRFGDVTGKYNYIDDVGELHNVEFIAGKNTGFHVKTPFPDSNPRRYYGRLYFRGRGKPIPRGRTSIQRGLDGSYRFVSAGPDQRRTETSDATGHVRGSYTYLDDKGVQHSVHYIAGPETGYRVLKNVKQPHLPTIYPFGRPEIIPPDFYDYIKDPGDVFDTAASGHVKPINNNVAGGVKPSRPGAGNKGPAFDGEDGKEDQFGNDLGKPDDKMDGSDEGGNKPSGAGDGDDFGRPTSGGGFNRPPSGTSSSSGGDGFNQPSTGAGSSRPSSGSGFNRPFTGGGSSRPSDDSDIDSEDFDDLFNVPSSPSGRPSKPPTRPRPVGGSGGGGGISGGGSFKPSGSGSGIFKPSGGGSSDDGSYKPEVSGGDVGDDGSYIPPGDVNQDDGSYRPSSDESGLDGSEGNISGLGFGGGESSRPVFGISGIGSGGSSAGGLPTPGLDSGDAGSSRPTSGEFPRPGLGPSGGGSSRPDLGTSSEFSGPGTGPSGGGISRPGSSISGGSFNKPIRPTGGSRPSKPFYQNDYDDDTNDLSLFGSESSNARPPYGSRPTVIQVQGGSGGGDCERCQGTIVTNLGDKLFSVPPGVSVRAHVQSIDLLPLIAKVPSPSEQYDEEMSIKTEQLNSAASDLVTNGTVTTESDIFLTTVATTTIPTTTVTTTEAVAVTTNA